MLHTGLLSVTFRKLPAREIVSLVSRAGLDAIEWGGDVHVPHGDVARAREVRAMTEDAGLGTCAYGSYYRLAHADPANPAFEKVLDSAVAIGAPLVRVWAGAAGSAQTDAAARAKVVADARRVAELAHQVGVLVALEYHANTLTDTNESAQQFLREVDHANLWTLWQPYVGRDHAYRLEGLRAVLPRLANVHVYHWPSAGVRGALAEGWDPWRDYLAPLLTTGRDHHALLEFVRDDSPEQFLADAATLRRWVSEFGP